MADPDRGGRPRPPEYTEKQKEPQGIDFRDILQLEKGDLETVQETFDDTEFERAYIDASMNSLGRFIFSLSGLGVRAIMREGQLHIEIDQDITKDTIQDLLHKYLERTKSDSIIEAKKLLEAREVANHDTMTGLLNEAGLEKNFVRELEKIPTNKKYKGVGFLFIDIDHFKRLNDTHGQTVGDEIIKSLAQRLKNRARSVDLVVRLGGEEMMIVLSNISKKNMAKTSREIHEYLKEKPFVVQTNGTSIELSVTTSVGGTHLSRQECIDSAPPKLLGRAKKESNLAERRSKDMGRDQVHLYYEMEKKSGMLTLEEFTAKYYKEHGIDRKLQELELELDQTESDFLRQKRTSDLAQEKLTIAQAIHLGHQAYLMRRLEQLERAKNELEKDLGPQESRVEKMGREIAAIMPLLQLEKKN